MTLTLNFLIMKLITPKKVLSVKVACSSSKSIIGTNFHSGSQLHIMIVIVSNSIKAHDQTPTHATGESDKYEQIRN